MRRFSEVVAAAGGANEEKRWVIDDPSLAWLCHSKRLSLSSAREREIQRVRDRETNTETE